MLCFAGRKDAVILQDFASPAATAAVPLQELRSRGVAQQHIDAAMVAVFGPGRQLPGRDAANDQEEGEDSR
jgi:hypothetical protein